MANAHQLIDCFNDTMHRIQTDPFLRAETMKSKADTVVYPVFWDNNQAAYFAKWLYFLIRVMWKWWLIPPFLQRASIYAMEMSGSKLRC